MRNVGSLDPNKVLNTNTTIMKNIININNKLDIPNHSHLIFANHILYIPTNTNADLFTIYDKNQIDLYNHLIKLLNNKLLKKINDN